MSIVSIAVMLLAQAAGAEKPGAGGYVPDGTPASLSELASLARLRDPRVRVVGFSSYDRTGGNNDGFNGTYSKLRVEGGDSVLAELPGAGMVQRIWFTHTSGDHPGLLDGKKEHLKIYLDGSMSPALDRPLEEIFSGKHPHFPRPLVGEGSGGFVCYVPIAFRNGCKIVVEGQGVRFYQINLLSLPGDRAPATFTEQPGVEEKRALERAVELWSHPDRAGAGLPDDAELARYSVEVQGESTVEYSLKRGPAAIRSLRVVPEPGTEAAWRSARLRLVWDHDEAAEAAVDVPLGHFFGWVESAMPYSSVLVGQGPDGWYNRFPMPYRRQAIVRIDTEQPLKGKVLVHTTRGIPAEAAYLHASFREEKAPQPKVDFRWLAEQGHGHFAGVLLMTGGKSKLPFWLEGDDRFRVDDGLAVHGTGTEDYFNCGWYALAGRLDGPACYPLHGFPVYRNERDQWQVAAYRWHLPDPVAFARSIEAGIEHGGENNVAAGYRAAVFWYLDRPGPRRKAS
jgi:hypothetical protein